MGLGKSYAPDDDTAIGIGLDCAVIPLSNSLNLLQTVDYFYPLVDDPVQMGRITCANVLSDLYAMGVCQVDSLDVVLKLSSAMTPQEQEVVTPMLLRGFSDAAAEAGCAINRVTAVVNPWCTLGGIATAVLPAGDFILPLNAQVGDLLVLTKPLGTQIACAAHTPSRWPRLEPVTTRAELDDLREHAAFSMGRLNLEAARLMHKHQARACTDVTGFGLLGHAQNLASFQRQAVAFVIERLPVMANAMKIARALGIGKLAAGISPETSGGLLIALPGPNAAAFCQDIEDREGCPAWIVGRVIEGNKTAQLVQELQIIEVPFQSKEASA